MKISLVFAVIAGIAWGVGGYYEKMGLRTLSLSPIVGITLRTVVALVILSLLSMSAWKTLNFHGDTRPWLMIIIGGGIFAGSFGMWSFYKALSLSENLGFTLAVAFACSPIAGTMMGLVNGNQQFDLRMVLGLAAIIAGIVIIQLAPR